MRAGGLAIVERLGDADHGEQRRVTVAEDRNIDPIVADAPSFIDEPARVARGGRARLMEAPVEVDRAAGNARAVEMLLAEEGPPPDRGRQQLVVTALECGAGPDVVATMHKHINIKRRQTPAIEASSAVRTAPTVTAGMAQVYFFRSLPIKSRFPRGTPFQRRMSYAVVA